jgi:hypothetical protein
MTTARDVAIHLEASKRRRSAHKSLKVNKTQIKREAKAAWEAAKSEVDLALRQSGYALATREESNEAWKRAQEAMKKADSLRAEYEALKTNTTRKKTER